MCFSLERNSGGGGGGRDDGDKIALIIQFFGYLYSYMPKSIYRIYRSAHCSPQANSLH